MSSRNLLVIDEDPAVHELLTSILNRDGRHIEVASDGNAALSLIEKKPVDLILLGPGRNGLDGMEMLRRVHRLRPDTPVILTGEEGDPARVVDAIREHAYSYFHKPLSPGTLADMVQQALDGSKWQDDIELVSAMPDWFTVRLSCKLEAAERMVQFLREVEVVMPAPQREDVVAAFRELVMNAIEHGGHLDPGKRVRISLIRTARSFLCYIGDPGSGFSLDLIPHAAVSNPDDSPIRHVELRAEQGQRPGGFGILMTRNLVDELVYNESGNEVLFIKYLN